jgi:hypothetical protein
MEALEMTVGNEKASMEKKQADAGIRNRRD